MFVNPLANFTLCFHESCNFHSVQRSLRTVPPQVRRSHDSCLPPITPNPSHASGEYFLERTTSRNHIPSPLAFSQTTISRPSRSRLFLSSSVSKAIPPRTYGEKKTTSFQPPLHIAQDHLPFPLLLTHRTNSVKPDDGGNTFASTHWSYPLGYPRSQISLPSVRCGGE